MAGQSVCIHGAKNKPCTRCKKLVTPLENSSHYTPRCLRCKGKKWYTHSINPHTTLVQTCDLCCNHSTGYFQLKDIYGRDNGKFSCRKGCGKLVDNTYFQPQIKQIRISVQFVKI